MIATSPKRDAASLRVVHVVLSLSPGGTERLVIDMIRRGRTRIDAMVVCLDSLGDWAPQVSSLGIPVVCLQRLPGLRPEIAPRLRQLVSPFQPHVLHCHQYSPFVYGAVSSILPLCRYGVVYTEHGRLSDAAPSMKRRVANRLLAKVRARLFAVSVDLKNHMVAEGFPASAVRVCHNGIEAGSPRTDASRAAARRRLRVDDSELIVGTVARLDPVKDFPTLLLAFRSVRDRWPARLVVIGDGPSLPELQELSEQLGLAAHVTWFGAQDDARTLMAGFDLYVNSSVTEGVSVTLLEAMAAGLPIVATRVGGTPEVVVDGTTGRLVPARDPGALAASMTRLLESPGLRQHMGSAARSRLEEHFLASRMDDEYRAAYEACRRRDR